MGERGFEENLKSEAARSADLFGVLADSCEDRVLFGHKGLLVERALLDSRGRVGVPAEMRSGVKT